jgi:type III pantothenate kinase
MKSKYPNVVIDAGNSRVKVAYFQEDELLDVKAFGNDELPLLKQYLLASKFDKAIVSSVRSPKDTQWLLQMMNKAILFQQISHYPITVNYLSPQTLGADRLANAIAAAILSDDNVLIIDVGTCLKFDFLSKQKSYEGGSISPGLHMRYKALNHFTGNLPLLSDTNSVELIGKTTLTCMQSGVLNGMQAEITQFIHRYEQDFQDLTIFVTGGDASYFDFPTKKRIFAHENLTLVGLNHTLRVHAQ